ncbi:hypothetical protein HIM_08020 [Hirsutella minnesotensis 3608]|uniref:Homeobox domain-containing protein n=1 Tax=Hirsutella minnesotensis 3608 TaxID=1043627 RepID=A0A0F7ZHH7_9HYPO|nr:hypothetical protein HIM_08020 [Hirsutella minnesotensis 3608]
MSASVPSASLPVAPERPAVSSSPDHRPGTASLQSLLHPADDASAPDATPDAEKHPKGKRKRTAAKDKMILEEAYRNNPKPDKQARLEIVDRVSLNEKEVQIWFQNRRQNDRRKSRPLSPEELAALKYSGLHAISSDPVSTRGALLDSDKPYPSSDPAASWPADPQSVSPPFNRTSPDQAQTLTDVATPRHASQENASQARPGATPLLGEDAPSSQQSQAHDSTSYSFSSSVGYLANRWNLGSSFSTPCSSGAAADDSPRPDSLPPPSCSSDATRNGNKSQSHVRLSLSLEGKAELVSNQASPARCAPIRPSSALSGPMPARRAGLQRSHSALPAITLPPISALTNSLPPRLIRGRSRDVHAWESCADSERRDELTTQAEHESNGSAIAAISLLRSSSAVLQPSSNKRNASLTRPQQPRQTKRAKFGRTSSTYARLENVDTDLDKPRQSFNGKVKVAMLMSPNDSDKENWSPDEDANPSARQRRRPLPSDPPLKSQNNRRQLRVLQEQKRPAMLGNRAHTAPSGPRGLNKGDVNIYEDVEKCRSREDEVERFMRGEVSPSKKGDMDCVAGLLSLSQGAWR